jgi:hypothetical protein
MSDIESAIDSDVIDILAAVGLSGIDSANIKARELPKRDETIDAVPCVVVAPYGFRVSPLGTEGSAGRNYTREICLIDGSEGDFATDQAKRQTWHQQVVNGIERNGSEWRTTLPNAGTVWAIEIENAPTFDRSLLAKNYAYQSVIVTFRSSE